MTQTPIDHLMRNDWAVETVSQWSVPPPHTNEPPTLRYMLDFAYNAMDESKMCIIRGPSRFTIYYPIGERDRYRSFTTRIIRTNHRINIDGQSVELFEFGFRYRLHAFLPQYPDRMVSIGMCSDLPTFRWDQNGVVSEEPIRLMVLEKMNVPFSIHIDLDHPTRYARPIFYSERDAMAYRLIM